MSPLLSHLYAPSSSSLVSFSTELTSISFIKFDFWDDLDLTNDEISQALHNLPPESSAVISGRSVLRLCPDASAKCGFIFHSEALAMETVKRWTTIPVPSVYRFFPSGDIPGTNCLVMKHIEGRALHECWGELSIWRRLHIIWTLRGYVKQLRQIPNPNPGTPGPIGTSPQQCFGILFSEDVRHISYWLK